MYRNGLLPAEIVFELHSFEVVQEQLSTEHGTELRYSQKAMQPCSIHFANQNSLVHLLSL